MLYYHFKNDQKLKYYVHKKGEEIEKNNTITLTFNSKYNLLSIGENSFLLPNQCQKFSKVQYIARTAKFFKPCPYKSLQEVVKEWSAAQTFFLGLNSNITQKF